LKSSKFPPLAPKHGDVIFVHTVFVSLAVEDEEFDWKQAPELLIHLSKPRASRESILFYTECVRVTESKERV
jgi:hypothetical protein